MPNETKIYTVSQVNSLIKAVLENNLPPRLTVTGEIVWSSQNGMGIQFGQLTPHQNKMIQIFSEMAEEVYKISS